MIKKFLLAGVAALALCSQANAVSFFNSQFDVTAVATVSDAPAGFDSQSGTALVSASADSIGATDVATAGAIGGPGVLTTSADVSAVSGIANAVATSHFLGSFLNTGPLALSIDFTPFSFASGSGLSTTSLFVLLTSDGVTLFNDFITGSRAFNFAAVAGTTGTLDLTLSSEVSGGFAAEGVGDASSAGQVSFTSPVPDPATWMLFVTGLGGLSVAIRRRQTRGRP